MMNMTWHDMTWHDLTWLDSWQDSWHKTKNKLYTFSCSRHTVKLATFPRTRNAVCFGSQIGVCLPLWHRWCFCALGPTLMKNRASYTLEIFKIFILSFWLSLHSSFFIIYFIIFIFLSFFKSFFHHFLTCFIIFYHVSSFFLPVVQKFSKKWKITIFLEFFHFFISFNHFFIIFASSGGIDEKW